MVELGQIALILSFMIAGYSSVVGFAGGMLNGRDLAASARWGFYSICPLLLLANGNSAKLGRSELTDLRRRHVSGGKNRDC